MVNDVMLLYLVRRRTLPTALDADWLVGILRRPEPAGAVLMEAATPHQPQLVLLLVELTRDVGNLSVHLPLFFRPHRDLCNNDDDNDDGTMRHKGNK